MKKRLFLLIFAIIILFSFLAYIVFSKDIKKFLPTDENEAQVLKRYYEEYNDVYALFQIYDLIDEGKISEDILNGVNQEIFDQFPRPSEGYYYQKLDMMEFEKVFNGRGEDYYEEYMFDNTFDYLYDVIEQDWIYISAFYTQESRDRVENGIIVMNNYFADPSEENLSKFEQMIFDENTLPGEVGFFGAYFEFSKDALTNITKNGKNYNINDYQKLELEEYGTSLRKLTASNIVILM